MRVSFDSLKASPRREFLRDFAACGPTQGWEMPQSILSQLDRDILMKFHRVDRQTMRQYVDIHEDDKDKWEFALRTELRIEEEV